MDDQTAGIFGVILILVIVVALIKGGIKTFQRNWIAALVFLIILTPIWAIWAFIELFTGDIVKERAQSTANSQSVSVTLVNQTNGMTKKNNGTQSDEYAEIIDARVINEEPLLGQHNASFLKDDTKDCPYCAEIIRRNAVVCRYCNRDI